MVRSTFRLAACFMAAALLLPMASSAQDDAGGVGPTFREGDIITFEKIEALRQFLPDEFWNNRDFFFYEGMQLEIGPFYYDYSPSQAYKDASKQYDGQAKIGPDNSLAEYTMGRPFNMDQIDCLGDPQAGVKIMFNFDNSWSGAGSSTDFYYYSIYA